MKWVSNVKIWVPILAIVILCLIGLMVFFYVKYQEAAEAKAALLPAQKAAVKTPVAITWLGYTAFKLTSDSKNVLIDPWINGNPQCPVKITDVYPADIILLSNSHSGLLADAVAIAKATGAKVVTTPEIAALLKTHGLAPEYILYGGSGINIGGEIIFEGIGIIMTEAQHSAQAGSSTGYIVRLPGGATIYYAGNTGIFGSMQVYGDIYPMHVALLPVGGVSAMDAYQAAQSLRLLRPARVIPMRFGTFPYLAQDADLFVKLAKQVAPEVGVEVLKPGQSYILKPGAY